MAQSGEMEKVRQEEAQYGYAILDDGKTLVGIKDRCINRDFAARHKFCCPYCHSEMYATFGEVQLYHFRHKGIQC